MEIRQLRYLVALADEQQFTRAAAREHVAQPALSQQIRRLEDELGLRLVERTTRHMTITDAGELLVARARRILAELDAANAEILALKGLHSGHVRVGTMHTMGPIDVSLVLAIFHERYRDIELTVREQSSEELGDMLRDDELDLAFLSVTERMESRGLGLHQLLLEELVVLLPVEHPLASRKGLRIGELVSEEFISFREGARLRELLFTAARGAGFEPNVKLESNESARIRRLVSRGMGVAILPRSDAVAAGADVAVLDLSEPPLARDITLAWREGRRHPPAVAEFLRLARETFSGHDVTDGTASDGRLSAHGTAVSI